MAVLLAYLFLALFISFLCSIMEASLLSTPQSYLMVKKDSGNASAQGFLDLKTNIDKPLSAILLLNTVAHTIGAAGVGAQAVKVYGEASFGIVSAVLTILVLVFTEIIPKTFGAKYWRCLSKMSVYILKGMIFITYPLLMISSVITRLISGSHHIQTTSREEIAALTNIGADEGVFSEKEHKIIQNVLKIKNVRVSEIMTPRVVVVLADETLTLSEFLKNKDYPKFSRIPVYQGNDDNVTEYVFRESVFEKLAEDQHQLTLKDIKRNIVYLPDSMVLFSLWEELLSKKSTLPLLLTNMAEWMELPPWKTSLKPCSALK